VAFPSYISMMPTFFFRFRTGNAIEDDPHGLELPDLDAAREEAMQAAREIVGNAVRFGINCLPDHIVICDSTDRSVLIVPLADALPPILRK
jgi:hypothetical protein